ncbi:hypothetical protein SISNIDRAFT_134141 [Sistotremastrum niveocremeum HHB9708]|nr:hypothetical protein SISNIDRAFT_134141 [Sistotremastrum niveocremeum HHB9708]
MILICLAYWAVSSLKSFVQRFKASRAAKRQPAYVAVDTAATPSPFAKGISNKDIFEPPAAHSNDDRDSILPLYRPNDQYDPPPSPKSGYKVVFPEPDHKLDAKAEP